MPFPALLHPAAQIGWQYFSVHWSTVVGIAALWALYEWRVRVHRARAATPEETAGPTRGERTLFVGGLLVMFLSLNGPLHDLSDYYLFSAHMVQHLLLTLVVPPLLILGTPGWMLRPALKTPWANAVARRVTGARAAFLIFSVVLAAWHLPPLYNLSMADHNIHIGEHLMFMVSATLMWWPLTSQLPELSPARVSGTDAVLLPDDDPDVDRRLQHHALRPPPLPGVRLRAAHLGHHADDGPGTRRPHHVGAGIALLRRGVLVRVQALGRGGLRRDRGSAGQLAAGVAAAGEPALSPRH